MRTRKGLAPIQIILIVIVAFVVISGAISAYESTESMQSAMDDADARQVNETDEIEEEEIEEPQEQLYHVSELTLNNDLVPLGVTIEVKATLNKISGNNPFPVHLYVSGELYEERDFSFTESDTIEIDFSITIDRQGKYEAHILDKRVEFEVREMPVVVQWVEAMPDEVEPNQPCEVSFKVKNPNGVSVSQTVFIEITPEAFHHIVHVNAFDEKTFTIPILRVHPGDYNIRIGEKTAYLKVLGSDPIVNEPSEFIYTPIKWNPDPLTWNMTNILPPEASSLRLNLPVPIESLYGDKFAGIGGVGLHAGGHIEGLDHSWIESTSTDPVKSWADGVVEFIDEHSHLDEVEFHVGIDYGDGLFGIHMELTEVLVSIGDEVKRGDPVGYGMSFFPGIQSAEFTLQDAGRTDGIYAWENGVYVSPIDYLVEEEKIALAAAYIENVIEPWVESGTQNGMFEPDQPYFTNPLMVHEGHEGKLYGEWYLISDEWAPGEPNDMITILEVDTPYYTGTKILGMDDTSLGGVSGWNFDSDCEVDYTTGRMTWLNWNEKRLYGIFTIDESSDRATLRIQYQTGDYPTDFTDDALTYIERTYISRRQDGVELGVASYSWE